MKDLINEKKIEIDYDFSGSTNYLIIDVPNGKDVINYQVQMLKNNESELFLKIKKIQINKKVQLYYDVENKITLSQLLKGEKMSKDNILVLIDNILKAYEEADELQLEPKGIALDKKYIYMETLHSGLGFVYLPFYKTSDGFENLSEFLKELKADNTFEAGFDGYYQTIMDSLSDPNMTLDKLNGIVNKLRISAPIADVPVPVDNSDSFGFDDDDFMSDDSNDDFDLDFSNSSNELDEIVKDTDMTSFNNFSMDDEKAEKLDFDALDDDFDDFNDFTEEKFDEPDDSFELDDDFIDEPVFEEVKEKPVVPDSKEETMKFLRQLSQNNDDDDDEDDEEEANDFDLKPSFEQNNNFSQNSFENQNLNTPPRPDNNFPNMGGNNDMFSNSNLSYGVHNNNEMSANDFETEFIDFNSEFHKEREKEIDNYLNSTGNKGRKKPIEPIVTPENTMASNRPGPLETNPLPPPPKEKKGFFSSFGKKKTKDTPPQSDPKLDNQANMGAPASPDFNSSQNMDGMGQPQNSMGQPPNNMGQPQVDMGMDRPPSSIDQFQNNLSYDDGNKKNKRKKEKPPKKEKPSKKEKAPAREGKSSGTKKSPPIAILIIGEILVCGLLAFGYLTDKFTAPDGGLQVANFAGTIILFIVVQYLLFRIFVKNSSGDSGGTIDEAPEEFIRPGKDIDNIGNINQTPNVQTDPRPSGNMLYNNTDQETPPPAFGASGFNFDDEGEFSQRVESAQPTKRGPMPFMEDDNDELEIEDTVYINNKKLPYLITEVSGVPTKIYITKPSFIIGRFVGKVDYVCQSNKVGKIHAEIISRDGLYFVNDLNSKNGTYINSYKQRIISNIDYPVDDGDVVILADVEFIFHEQ